MYRPGDLVSPTKSTFVWANDQGRVSLRKLLTLKPNDCSLVIHVSTEQITNAYFGLIVCGLHNEVGWIDLNQVTKL